MIKIDDAGWGCLVGGVILGIYREETHDYNYGEIPVEIFQGQKFQKKEYFQSAYQITPELLQSLNVSKKEQIMVCTGEVLGGVRRYLSDHGYNWKSGKIKGGLQTKVEKTLQEKLFSYGIRVDFKTLTEKQGLLFWMCVKWLKGGNLNGRAIPEREKLCKTGWRTFRIWADLPYDKAKEESKRLKRQLARARLSGY